METEQQQVGKYRIVGKLGQGGMARVFKAVFADDGTTVALKVFSAEDLSHPDFLKRCKREVQALEQCVHPNIVKVHGYQLDATAGYVALEFIDGATLDQVVRKSGHQGKELIMRVARDVASALAFCHSKGIYHRDIKPANIMIEAGSGRAVLLDFGLVKATQMTEISIANQVMGTLCYMAPEQFLGQPVDARTDIYQFGLVLHKLATTQDPPPVSEMLETGKVPDVSPLTLDGKAVRLPSGLVRIMENCVPPRKDDRYPQAQLILEDLDRTAQGKPVARRRRIAPTQKFKVAVTGKVDQTMTTSPFSFSAARGLKRRWLVGLIGLSPILILLVVLAAGLILRHR